MYPCFICGEPIEPREDGTIRLEGVTGFDDHDWVWGPVMVHYQCRVRIRTPFDDLVWEAKCVARSIGLRVVQ